MSKCVSLQEMSALMDETLRNGGEVVLTPAGNSMRPLLRNRQDKIILVKLSRELKKYDIPLYRRKDGTFVLHRVVAVKEDGYVLCGDHHWQREYGISHDQIIAIVRALYRGEKYIDCQVNRTYRLYCVIWTALLPVRRMFFRAQSFVSRIGRNSLAG